MMNSGGHFDANATFSGGGFNTTQSTQAAADHSTPSKFQRTDVQRLVPLTVKQIFDAASSSDDRVNLLVDGVDVTNAKLVGMVLNKTDSVTKVSLVLDDGTGRIECERWVHDQVESKEIEAIQNGMYVQVHGILKFFQGKKHLVIFRIRPVTEFDEITYHFVECIYVHAYNTKLKKLQSGASNPVPVQGSSFNTPMKPYQPGPSNQYVGNHNVGGVQGIDNMVLQYMAQPSCFARESGIHRDELAAQLGLPMGKIMEAIHALEQEGLIYNTIDDFHYRCTANG